MRRASMAGVTAPAWSLPSRSRTTCWDQGDGTEVCWPVPGPTFFHDTQARQKDRVRWPTRVVKPAMCSTVQLRILDRGRDEGATRPKPHALQEPLKHNCVLLWRLADQEDGEWSGNPWSTTRLGGCRKPSFAAPSSSRAAPGVRWPGWLA